MMNRAISSAYPPGSINKIILAVAGLTEGVIDEKSVFHCPGYFALKDDAIIAISAVDTGQSISDKQFALLVIATFTS